MTFWLPNFHTNFILLSVATFWLPNFHADISHYWVWTANLHLHVTMKLVCITNFLCCRQKSAKPMLSMLLALRSISTCALQESYMSVMASQITGNMTICSSWQQRKCHNYVLLAPYKGNPMVIGGFLSSKPSNVEHISMLWHVHDRQVSLRSVTRDFTCSCFNVPFVSCLPGDAL